MPNAARGTATSGIQLRNRASSGGTGDSYLLIAIRRPKPSLLDVGLRAFGFELGLGIRRGFLGDGAEHRRGALAVATLW